jgi:Zn-dependent M28 family amino/carboxypeptidase
MQSFGPRTPGSEAHFKAAEFITNTLITNGWIVKFQVDSIESQPIKNIVAIKNNAPIHTIIGSHYDSRMLADRESNPKLMSLAVPGANDGGSSTVVLLELSRLITEENLDGFALVFFDAEDQGNINNLEWIMGSRFFVENLSFFPERMILLDMVGGFDQRISPPQNSNEELYEAFLSISNRIGYEEYFLPQSHSAILDDHVPFLNAGIPALNLIDINDQRWHTTEDDQENVNLQSLQRIGDVFYTWIIQY